MDGIDWMELLDIYTDMIEKQDEIIRRLVKIVSRQSETLQLLKNDEYFDPIIEKEKVMAKKALNEYEGFNKG